MTLRISPHSTPIPCTSGHQLGIAKLKPWLGGLCLAASLGAHGVLLGLPWSPSANETEDLAAIEEPPPMTMDVAVLPTRLAQAEPEPPLPVARPAATRPAAVAVNPSTRAIPPSPQPVAEVIPAPAEPLATAPESPVTEPISTDPEPEPIAEPVTEPVTEPEPQPYADFPHFQGAQQADCGGETCWTSPVEGGWRGAAGSLQDNLEAQGYTLSNITGEVLSTETGVRVYQVTKDGEDPYYLNLVSVTEGILYSLTPAPLTEDRLVALQAL